MTLPANCTRPMTRKENGSAINCQSCCPVKDSCFHGAFSHSSTRYQCRCGMPAWKYARQPHSARHGPGQFPSLRNFPLRLPSRHHTGIFFFHIHSFQQRFSYPASPTPIPFNFAYSQPFSRRLQTIPRLYGQTVILALSFRPNPFIISLQATAVSEYERKGNGL